MQVGVQVYAVLSGQVGEVGFAVGNKVEIFQYTALEQVVYV